MKTVKFIKGSSPYQAGEVAGFPDEIARRLIASGVAEEVKPEPPLEMAKEYKPERDKMVRKPRVKK